MTDTRPLADTATPVRFVDPQGRSRRARWWRWLAAWTAAGLVAFAPMGWAVRLAAEDVTAENGATDGGPADGGRPGGLAVADTGGTIWSGRIDGLRWRGALLGDHRAALAPGALLSGRLGLDLVARHADPALPGLTGRIEVGLGGGSDASGGGWRVAGLSGRIDPDPSLARLGVRSILLGGVDALVVNGACQAASGRVLVALGVPPGRLGGPIACRAGRITARLDPVPEAGSATATTSVPFAPGIGITLDARGRLAARIVAPSPRPAP